MKNAIERYIEIKTVNGYILISRSIVESEIWRKPPLYLKVWIWLLSNAQFKKYKDIDRGELITSIEEIRQACVYYSGYRKEIPTKKQIYNILEWLRNPHGRDNGRDTGGAMVVTTAVTEGIRVNICNFNKYQAPENYGRNSGRDNGRDTGGTTDGNPTLLKKKEKKENNNIYITPYLGEFENVLLTEEELEKLQERFPYDCQDRIDRLSAYRASKGKRYKSHYATILTWARKETEGKEDKPKGRLDWIDEI